MKDSHLKDQPGAAPRSVEAWARAYVESTSLSEKCRPTPPPEHWAVAPQSADLSPGRPSELRVTMRLPQSVKLGALRDADKRVELMHKFWHHELQAAELMAWAIVRFSDAPLDFKKGLLRIFQDEVRHMGLYESYMNEHGACPGDFAVRDWIWGRVQECSSPLAFVALLGMGFEGANLDHAERYAARFHALGDEAGARIQEQVGREEIAHVRFATRWFQTFSGDLSFDKWRASLPPDLGPMAVRGRVLHEKYRVAAGMPQQFVDALGAWKNA